MLDVWIEGMELTPLASLVDSGALRTRLPAELGALAGIELAGAPTEVVVVGGLQTRASMARVNLSVRDGEESHTWDAPVWFCDPWPYGFGLLGLDGLLRHFRMTMSAYEEWIEVVPEGGGTH